MLCHHTCDKTWTTIISYRHWKDIRLGCSQSRHILTSCVRVPQKPYLIGTFNTVAVAGCCSMHVYSDNRSLLPRHHTADTLLQQEATPCHQQSPHQVWCRLLRHDRSRCLVRHRCGLFPDETCRDIVRSTSSDIVHPTTSRLWYRENGGDCRCDPSSGRTHSTAIQTLASYSSPYMPWIPAYHHSNKQIHSLCDGNCAFVPVYISVMPYSNIWINFCKILGGSASVQGTVKFWSRSVSIQDFQWGIYWR